MCAAFIVIIPMFPFMLIVYHPNYSFVPLLFCVIQPQHKTGQRKKLPTRCALLNSLALWDGKGTGSAMWAEFNYGKRVLLLSSQTIAFTHTYFQDHYYYYYCYYYYYFQLHTAAFKAYCAIWVRRSNFRHQASPRVSPRETTHRRLVELWARKCPVILPKWRFPRYT